MLVVDYIYYVTEQASEDSNAKWNIPVFSHDDRGNTVAAASGMAAVSRFSSGAETEEDNHR